MVESKNVSNNARKHDNYGLFTWSKVQNFLQNVQLQKFCKNFADFFATLLQIFCNFFATFFAIFLQFFFNFFAIFLQLFCNFFANFLQKMCKNFFKKRKELEVMNLSFNSLF